MFGRPGGRRPPRRTTPRCGWRPLVRLLVGHRGVWLRRLVCVSAARRSGVPAAENRPRPRAVNRGPMPVGTAPVEKGDMPVALTALGTVTPLATVTVKTQISGQLIDVAFKEGQMVNKGDFLAQIDPRPYQVALAQAEGQLAKDQALLKNAELDLARYNTLVAQNSIAKQTLDTQASLVAADTRRRAGRPGAGRCAEAQPDLLPHRRAGQRPGRAAPGRSRQLRADQRSQRHRRHHPAAADLGDLHPAGRQSAGGAAAGACRRGACRSPPSTAPAPPSSPPARLETVDNQIDTTTGTVKLRAIFDNRAGSCSRTSSSTSSCCVDTLRDATSCRVAAVQRGAPGTFVYLVKPDETVAVQPVKLGPATGSASRF